MTNRNCIYPTWTEGALSARWHALAYMMVHVHFTGCSKSATRRAYGFTRQKTPAMLEGFDSDERCTRNDPHMRSSSTSRLERWLIWIEYPSSLQTCCYLVCRGQNTLDLTPKFVQWRLVKCGNDKRKRETSISTLLSSLICPLLKSHPKIKISLADMYQSLWTKALWLAG